MLLWTLLVEHVTMVTRLLFALGVIVIEVQVRMGGAGRGPVFPLLVWAYFLHWPLHGFPQAVCS